MGGMGGGRDGDEGVGEEMSLLVVLVMGLKREGVFGEGCG